MSTEQFEHAQRRFLERCGVRADSRILQTPAVGRTHILVVGEGPPVMMAIGGGAPGAQWAPLMTELQSDFTLYAVDRPGFGLTDTAPHTSERLRSLAVDFLSQTLDAAGLERVPFVSNPMGALWTA